MPPKPEQRSRPSVAALMGVSMAGNESNSGRISGDTASANEAATPPAPADSPQLEAAAVANAGALPKPVDKLVSIASQLGGYYDKSRVDWTRTAEQEDDKAELKKFGYESEHESDIENDAHEGDDVEEATGRTGMVKGYGDDMLSCWVTVSVQGTHETVQLLPKASKHEYVPSIHGYNRTRLSYVTLSL